ncbi:MAG: hypothetical protein KF817_04110 [Phycisphaeraceae bacterium]|nr:hypothetical protein [Phycisphaeraceae bacterium]
MTGDGSPCTQADDVPTEADARASLRDHVVAKARAARAHYADGSGTAAGGIGRAALLRMLEDRTVVRYPLGIRFDAAPLKKGEFACLEPLGDHPSDGYCLFIHPLFAPVDHLIPALVAYYIPSVNYGDVVSHVEAELFGAALLGLDVDAYYTMLCAAADSLTR